MQVQSFNFEEIKPVIYSYVREALGELLKERDRAEFKVSNYELLERIVKVEEELKHQRELSNLILKHMEKRFEQIDKRFEQVDKKFEQIDKRFEELTTRLDRFMFWSLGLVMSSTILIIGYMHYFLK